MPLTQTLNDKWLHCVVGCLTGQKYTPQDAKWVGWYKEYRDLTDCDPSTHDPADYTATAVGAKIKGDCENGCEQIYQRNR